MTNLDTILQELEETRAERAADLGRLDTAIAALRGTGGGNGKLLAALTKPPKAKPAKAAGKPHRKGKPTGGGPKWDIVLAERLWKSGVPVTEIADRVGAKPDSLYERAARCKWGKRPTTATTRTKCKACGSMVTTGQTCPSCGIPA
jgi:hypothetical protein